MSYRSVSTSHWPLLDYPRDEQRQFNRNWGVVLFWGCKEDIFHGLQRSCSLNKSSCMHWSWNRWDWWHNTTQLLDHHLLLRHGFIVWPLINNISLSKSQIVGTDDQHKFNSTHGQCSNPIPPPSASHQESVTHSFRGMNVRDVQVHACATVRGEIGGDGNRCRCSITLARKSKAFARSCTYWSQKIWLFD